MQLMGLRFSALAASARVLWAKSADNGAGHGLLAHLLDVAAVAESILELEPEASTTKIAQGLGLAPHQLGRWVATLAGLHDYGKAIPGFQAKWPAGYAANQATGLPFNARSLQCSNHSLATAALLGPPLQNLSGAEHPWCVHTVQAISAHHGYHFTSSELSFGKPLREGEPWGETRAQLLEVYWAVLAPQGRPSVAELSLPQVNWLAGLTSVADWIASNPAWFPLGERCDELQAYYQGAKVLAHQALGHIGWRAYRPLLTQPQGVDELLARIVQRPGLQARALQRAGDELLLGAQGPALLLVEAPMGEGKTELAFLAHLRLQAANQHRGLYVALPTQATGNALFKRAETFLRAFATDQTDIQLVHGGAAMNEDLAALQDVNRSPEDTLSASEWFGQRRRPLLSPYGVGTVDQALYAVLNVKHHFVRMWGLSNRVVVLDEVHAYDTYTLGLITTLLRWLKVLGCSVVLMSATLPRARCRELLDAWGLDQAPPELPYPRLMLADDAGVRGRHVAARALAPITLTGLGSDITDLADVALAQIAEGGCGALIVNTVARAQALYQALQAGLHEGTMLVLFHARFPADERAVLEARVLSLFGATGQRPERALLVATQVAEQSLDIDFDFMLSDLAPVDLLLQRAGRLHRHTRAQRPAAHREARLWVAGLLPGEFPELNKTAWGFVYEPYILGRTWALLSQETRLQLPQDIDRLVQAVYDMNQDLPEALAIEIRDRIEVGELGSYLAETRTERQQACNIALDPAAEAHLVYDGKPRGHEEDESGLGLSNTTRLGPESITLIPVIVGATGRWHVREGDKGFDPEQAVDASTARALYNRQIKLSRKGVVKRCQAQGVPVAFASHALLRHAYVLRLVQGQAVDPGLNLSLSPELGLVFKETEHNKTQEGAT
ncbi:CRISPR-associated endonuclease/helicase Cas3 [Paucibacter oligotrophus]|uniref:CRISPR-associated endonuclease/helicase Cas3 n=1 Tax=Roseateles oligotrophus TaxID=1769250 RepID=A0A840L9K9_9BURK|nr:CRISPR-associated helicase Cas3' [Roseateles oligotrophus]MBB4842878.1 CRISPR-associated endonuclease/helicase Cas3 [Roseateles oligotrophus]